MANQTAASGAAAPTRPVSGEFTLDASRRERTGLDEAIFCAGKSVAQIDAILTHAEAAGRRLLLTRLDPATLAALPDARRTGLDYDPISRTAILGPAEPPAAAEARVGVVTAGSSDVPVAREATRTLRYDGHPCREVHDVGVAGLWRLLDRIDELRRLEVVIAVAGMEAALASVVGGLVPGAVIAVPTSTGYGVAAGGETALRAALTSCAPGITVVNIDNGYGAACAAARILNARPRPPAGSSS